MPLCIPAFTDVAKIESLQTWQRTAPHGYALGFTSEDLAVGAESCMTRVGLDHTLATDVSSRFGRRLRELRRERSLTQTDMAKKFGIDRSFISDVERGRKSISLPMLEVMALGLRVSLADLFRDL